MLEEEIKINFARNIKELRISRKLNQVQLGEMIHYSSKAISKWENADVLPDITTLKMIADFFSVSVDDLISNKNVVRKSHRKLNRFLITASSAFLGFSLGALLFMILYFNNVPNAWLSFIGGLISSAIVLVVFSSLWFKKFMLVISVDVLILLVALFVICITNFEYYWIYIIVSAMLSISSTFFFNIKFHSKRSH